MEDDLPAIFSPTRLAKHKPLVELPKQEVAILGGSFNPPTIGHMQIAAEVINTGAADEVWIVPCGNRHDKKLEDQNHRINMLNLIIDDIFQSKFPIKVNDIETKHGSTIPTYYLMKDFMGSFPKIEFFFILGSDLLADMPKWDDGDKLKNEINFVIFNRTGYPIKKEDLPKNYILLNSPFIASSSSEVRKRIKDSYTPIEENYDGSEKHSFPENTKLGVPLISDPRSLSIQTRNLKDKYRGVYGIIPVSIIDYIKENSLYKD